MELRDRLQSTLGSAYSVERELGGGGMSRVFLAREISLDRNVVVKVLKADLAAGLSAERFAREVRLAASLQHPNIVPVLAAGVADGIPYYTMPYVRGESLRARLKQTPVLPLREAVSLLRDVARALQYAHGEGVIHRDIKPENVLLSGDVASVTDFGIAKAISVAQTSTTDGSDADSGMTLTQAGSAIGTPGYMAPEQVVGDTLDNRVDIYSWGLLAYEILAGAHPFADKTSAAQLMAAQVSQRPIHLIERAPGVPPHLAQLVMDSLQKAPDDRPSSAGDLLEDLDPRQPSAERLLVAAKPRRSYLVPAVALGLLILLAVAGYFFSSRPQKTAAPIPKSSVAVLPFADDAADSANAYFGEGIADELMSALGKVPGLRVASRTSAIAIGRRRDLDVREIADRLGVSTVVEGTVRRAGGHLRVTAQLTNAADGLTLWSDVYDRDSKDVFAVQDDITRAIVAALRPEFARTASTSSNRPGPGTSNPAAYDLYLRGLYLMERRGAGVPRAADYFAQAVHQDTTFARAYGALAQALEFFPYFAAVPPQRVAERVRAAANKSLELDQTLAEPRVALAMMHWHAYQWAEADAEFRRAIAADSTAPVAHTQYGRFLFGTARLDDALREFRIARRLDPLAPTASVWLSHTLSAFGEHAAAWEESKRARELDPDLFTARAVLAYDRIAIGKFDEARAIVGEAIKTTPFDGMRAYTLQRAGDTARAGAVWRELRAKPDTTWMIHIARTYEYLARRDTARALSEIEAAADAGELVPQQLNFVERSVDVVRHTPRFAAIVRRFGLDPRTFTGPNGGRPAR
jgi:serine/threonine protein kinase/tetratricopeptide (TPR) repeat protein